MGNALWIGISGLNCSSRQIDVAGNNIANVNTIGFKGGKIFFSNVLSQSLSGGGGAMQTGRGVQISAINTSFAVGSCETTGSATDLFIDGEGFFIVEDAAGAMYYTRAGAFSIDKDGYLVDLNGYGVQGYSVTPSGTMGTSIGDIPLRNVQSAPQTTTQFSLGLNLNSETATGEVFNSTQTAYDSLGEAHDLSVAFRKTEAAGYWGFESTLDGTAATAQDYSGLYFDGNGDLQYVYNSVMSALTVTSAAGGAAATVNKEGQMYKDTTANITLSRGANPGDWSVTVDGGYTNYAIQLGTAGVDDEITIDLDGAGGTDITIDLTTGLGWLSGETIDFSINQTETAPVDMTMTFTDPLANGASIGVAGVVTWDMAGATAETMTGYASTSVIRGITSNGYSSGILKSLSVEKDGIITGFFTNGQTSNLAQVILADFPSAGGLKKMGSNLFAETLTSGEPIRNVPGSAGLGEIISSSIEMSNTDMAAEFVNLITAQRAYQASAKIITTADQMLAELMNIKR